MTAAIRRLTLAVVGFLSLHCGGDHGPTGATAPLANGTASLSIASGRPLSNGPTVADILGNPTAYVGQAVELQGRATERFPSGELLFNDGTGGMPADFSLTGSAPELNVAIALTGSVAPGVVGGFAVKIAVTSWTAAPAFSCEDIVEARARFTDPGYVFGNVAGLFLSYQGVPPGEKRLKVFWDVNNPSGAVEELSVGEGVPTEDGLYLLEGIVSYEYPDITGTVTKDVRAELSIEGRDGACSRVRDVTLSPGSGPGWAGGGTISVSIDEGTTIKSGSTFGVRARISNPTTLSVDVHVLFQTPDQSSIAEASGAGCSVVDADLVDCAVSLKGEEVITRVVRYQAPSVAAAIQIAGSSGLVTGEFSPVVPYRITVQP